MSSYRCKSTPEAIHAFLGAVDNQWRNAAFIQCNACKHEKSEACANLLFAIDKDGTPILMPEKDADVIFGRLIDMSECNFIISNFHFTRLYDSWLKEHSNNNHTCPMLQQILHVD